MLRLDYFLMRSGLLAKGDLCADEDGDDTPMEYDCLAEYWNKDEEENSRCHIKSFALRDNNGKQPVPYDFPVVVTFVNGYEYCALASGFNWGELKGITMIKSWKPDCGKLLEQQNEYDKQQEKPIEEIILDAKSGLTRHDLMGDKVMTQQQENMREFASWLLAEIEDSMAIGDDISSLYNKFLNHKKLKNELSTAKEKQIEDALQELTDTKMMKFNRPFTRTMLEIMQGKGLLAEIILPLED